MVLPSFYSSETNKKEQTILYRKCSLWSRQYRLGSPWYRCTVGGLGCIIVWLTICIIWRKVALDYELRRGAVLFRTLYPPPPSLPSSPSPFLSTSPSMPLETTEVLTPSVPIPILIPVYSRPEYLQRVINSLKNTHNINQVRVSIFSRPIGGTGF